MQYRIPVVVVITAAVVVACGTADFMGTPLNGTSGDKTGTEPTPGVGMGDCEGPTTLEKTDPATLPACCDGTSHCMPKAKVPGLVRKALAECEGGYCVPDTFLVSGGEAPASCTAFNGQPGACMSTCVPEVGKSASILTQANCAGTERCAPCIHPLTNAVTGVCEIGKYNKGTLPPICFDGGAAGGGAPTECIPHAGPPVIDPSKLPACGDVAGAHCLDKNLIPADMQSKLAPCATGLCVPDVFIAAGGKFVPATCTSLGGQEGRCLHKVLPDVAKQASILPVATCGAGELCAPCFHPADGVDTGACRQSCDTGPKQGAPACPHTGADVFNPSSFPSCGAGAHCMPPSHVTPAMSELASCGGGGRCVPDVFIKSGGRFIPATCTAIGGAEGRCLHKSIPQIAEQKNLTQSSCQSYEKCTPCFNPIDGTETGACKRSCDPGPTKPAYVFPRCCSRGGATRGRCVPPAAIPDQQEESLSRDTCAGSNLCVPSENLDPDFHPTRCTAPAAIYLGSYSGVCLSTCLTFSGLQDTIVKQGTCDSLHQCVPCNKPLGAPTGAPGCN